MCDTATIIHLKTDRIYQIEGGWRSYETQACQSDEGEFERQITLIDTKDSSTRAICFTETLKQIESKKNQEVITVTGTFLDRTKSHERTIRIVMNRGRGDCTAVILND